ncbi:hypothetical protein K505DRAFT_160782 [Melanomma pulvis-pyrius CBS 109.77]|uniref:Uncharacterized protein n=1 Tax=Melanomma pulvis-pyrius CBS 109.77 TaxID=1314802 RepID=A0A6A6XK57_9PLEO|nr:hypothetical protein K505DRAFT_160782 [Melanomma pulvis-pyrius CBS 109.77]
MHLFFRQVSGCFVLSSSSNLLRALMLLFIQQFSSLALSSGSNMLLTLIQCTISSNNSQDTLILSSGYPAYQLTLHQQSVPTKLISKPAYHPILPPTRTHDEPWKPRRIKTPVARRPPLRPEGAALTAAHVHSCDRPAQRQNKQLRLWLTAQHQFTPTIERRTIQTG